MRAPIRATAQTALLVIDMVSCWDFPDAAPLLVQARKIAPAIARLAARCRVAGIPVIYANDNRGQWQSDFRTLVETALACPGGPGEITRAIAPREEDYFILKPKQSAFFGTPLELLLQHLGARRLVLTGVSSDQCVLVTAFEARMRDMQVVVPADCVASQSVSRNRTALAQCRDTHGIPVTPSSRLRLLQARTEPRSRRKTTTGG